MSVHTKVKMEKKKFRIGECAKHLNLERFVIRFWEKEFNLTTDRSSGGQRFYSNEDIALFKEIKNLLYQKGFTIAGAKKHIAQSRSFKTPDFTKKLEIETNSYVKEQIYANEQTYTQKYEKKEQALLEENKKLTIEKEELKNQLLHLNRQLHKLQNLL